MRKEEIVIINFILRHVTEFPAREAGEVLYALASLTSDKQMCQSLFEKAKEIESVRDGLREICECELMETKK